MNRVNVRQYTSIHPRGPLSARLHPLSKLTLPYPSFYSLCGWRLRAGPVPVLNERTGERRLGPLWPAGHCKLTAAVVCGLNGAERRWGWGRAWRTPEEPLSLPGLRCISYTPSVCLLWRGKSGTLHLSCWEEEHGCGRIVFFFCSGRFLTEWNYLELSKRQPW